MPLSPLSRAIALLTTPKALALTLPAALAFGALVSMGGQPAPAQAPTGAAAPATAGKGAGPFSAEQKAAIEGIIKDYLISNPEVMLEIQTALESKMEKIQAERLKVAIAANSAEIFRHATTPTVGNPKGDVTIVEFFDYNCGYCKRGFGDLAKLIEKDPKVKVVMKELPILSKGSEEAAVVALAAARQGKYWEVHRGLLESRGQANEAAALKIAEKAGADMTRLRKDMDSAEVKGEIQHARDLAQKMGIQGTPHFLVADRQIAGAPENLLGTLEGLVAEVRKTGCQIC